MSIVLTIVAIILAVVCMATGVIFAEREWKSSAKKLKTLVTFVKALFFVPCGLIIITLWEIPCDFVSDVSQRIRTSRHRRVKRAQLGGRVRPLDRD